MRKFLVAASLIIAVVLQANSQTQHTLPYSFTHGQLVQSTYPTITCEKPETASLVAEDEEREKQGFFYRTGVMVKPDVPITEADGYWESHADGTSSWFMVLKSDDATALGLYFDYFNLPEGGELFVYNESKTHVVGPYNTENSSSNDVFATAPVLGDKIIVEYHGPSQSTDELKITLGEVAYMYRNGGFGPKDAGQYGDSDACEVNANCSEGASWDAQRRSVVKIILVDNGFPGLCSGAMINSTNNDCTPYVLTANHCGGGATLNNFKQWVFFFNFETPGCTNPASASNLDDQTVTGCLKMANASDVSDVITSDFLLVHLKNRPATSFNAFMAGWSRSSSASTSGVGIHHPAGDVKKISTYTTTLTNSSWSGSNTGKHWGVKWAATTNGHGVTEGGSSGSPIFDQIGRIVGDLSGGSSFCSNTNGQDVYGKFVYSWDQAGTTSNRRLKDWLDKGGLNSTTLNGKEVNSCASASLPVVDFVASDVTPAVGATVNLTNQSTGTAFGYQWYITPTTYTYVNGTSELSENPQVQFNSTSFYSVTLHVFNEAGYNLKLRTAYIKPTNSASINENDELTKPVIFPNPSNGQFQVYSSSTPLTKVEVIDMNGKVVYQWNGKNTSLSVDLHEFAKGIYTIRMQANTSVSIEKLILQ